MTDRDEQPPSFAIPDLELEPAVSKRPQPDSPRAPQAPAPAPDSVFGDDDFELIQTGSKVELATGVTGPDATRRLDTASWPTGRSRPTDQLPIDPAEVALVAGYGPAPSSALLAPAYAYRVYARRGLLRRAVREHHAALVQAEAARDAALATLTGELRQSLEGNEMFRRLLEPIRDIERLAGERQAALSQADTDYRERMAQFDGQLAELTARAQQLEAQIAEREAAGQATENELRRAEAKHQRVQIEMRGVMDLARRAVGPAGGAMPPAQAAQLAELQARATALEPEVARANDSHRATTAALDQARAELREVGARTRALQRQKAAAGAGLEQQLSARTAGVGEAEQQRVEALAEIARAVLAGRGSVAVPAATLQALREHDAQVEARAVRLETHVRALDSQDRERVRQGVTLVLWALGLVVLAVALKAVL